MIVGLLQLYDLAVTLSVAIGIGYILYSGDFVVIHREFLFRFGIGAGLSGVLQVGFFLVQPSAVLFAHIPFVLFVLAGVLSLIRGSAICEEPWFKALFHT